MKRKCFLEQEQTYHIFNRSIANYTIFNDPSEYQRMIHLLKYFQLANLPMKFSYFTELKQVQQMGFDGYLNFINQDQEKLVHIIAYCLMPTHIHLILKQLEQNGISKFMGNICNGYTRYFNTLHNRKGPLWESKFKNVLIENDNQLTHLTRYLHLNPVSARLVILPENWLFSSYAEYLGKNINNPLCQFNDLLDIKPKEYKKFVNNQIAYQRELVIIKKYLID